jgi:hypothetical protein
MLKEVQAVVLSFFFNGKIVKPLNLYRTLSRKYTVLRFVEAVKGGGNLNDADCPLAQSSIMVSVCLLRRFSFFKILYHSWALIFWSRRIDRLLQVLA